MSTNHSNNLDSALAERPRLNAPGRERVLIMGFLYLQAGLPPEAAYRSAMADYVALFSGGGE